MTGKGLVCCNNLYTLGGGASDAIQIARAMSRFMPTDLATLTPIPPQVQETMGGLSVVHYAGNMAANYDVLFNVSHNWYAAPTAKRNIARVFQPTNLNTAPEAFELFANSKFTAEQVKKVWSRPCEVLYPPIARPFRAWAKKNIILNVARFAAPSIDADKGQAFLLETFRALWDSGFQDWQLVLAGSFEAGQEAYLGQIMGQAKYTNVKVLPNVEPDSLARLYGEAAFYWHGTGFGKPDVPSAQEHLGLTTIEAMTAGCFVITHGTGGQPEIVRNGYDGLLAKNPQELYDLTARVISMMSAWSMVTQRAQVSSLGFASQRQWYERVGALLDGKPIPEVQRESWLEKYGDPSEVCAVIPVHNQRLFTVRCLESIKKNAPALKVIVIDNASSDSTQSTIPALVEAMGGVYVRREVNNGFAAANMAAKEYCDRPYVLMLNNDCEITQDECIAILLSEMRDPKVGAVAPKLTYADGRIQFAGALWDREKGVGVHNLYGQPDQPAANQRTVGGYLTGAFILLRRELFDLDTDLELNAEDVALSLNIQKQGYEIVYQPAAYAIHYERATKEKTPGAQEQEAISNALFAAKYADDLGLVS